MDFFEAVKKRRSCYCVGKETTLTDEQLVELLKEAVTYSPSSFNSQSSRVVLLLGEKHTEFWEIVRETLRKVVPEGEFEPTDQKLNLCTAGYGTILFYEEQETVKYLQDTYPLYAENFPVWSEQSAGMLQYVVWTALADKGMGATLHHYNPLIDEEVAEKFGIKKSWKLIGQMPFGVVTVPAQDLEYLPAEERVLVK